MIISFSFFIFFSCLIYLFINDLKILVYWRKKTKKKSESTIENVHVLFMNFIQKKKFHIKDQDQYDDVDGKEKKINKFDPLTAKIIKHDDDFYFIFGIYVCVVISYQSESNKQKS